VFATANFVVERAATLADWTTPFTVIGWLDTANTLILPVAIFVGIGSINRRRGPLGDLMVELSSTPAGEVGPALARSLGDPTLTLALWLPDRRVFVDERGVEVQLPREQLGRAVTLVGSEPAPLAAIVHDDRLLDQQALLEAAGSAATLALENTRLQAELRAQLAELKASRARVVSSADAERRRVERDLHDGAQQRLLALGLALQLLRDRGGDSELLGDAERELHAALAELRDLARGIHPAILTEQGLAPAIRSLVDRTAMPVRVNLEEGRFAQEVETAAYFFVSEALANVSKHAEATTAAVTVARSNGNLVIEVADDGRGGATSSGSGLQGLADRVGALDGRLAIESDEGRGTIIRAEIPCASS
jgi:signal transduction histidine kinase